MTAEADEPTGPSDDRESDDRGRGEREAERDREGRPSGERRVRVGRSWASRLGRQLEEWPVEVVVQVLVTTVVLGSTLAIGAVHPPVMLVMGLLSALALAVALAMRATERRLPLSWPAIVMFALSGVCLLQLVPLPMRVLTVLSPAAADAWSRSLAPFEVAPPGFAPLSLDPGATWIEALRWFSYGANFTAAAAVSARSGATWGVSIVFVAALVAAVATVAHGLIGLELVYGLYAPSFQPSPWHVGPLLNPNNLAGLLNLGSLCGLGLLFESKPPAPRPAIGVGVAALVGVNVTAASRGGVLTLLIGVIALVVALETSRARRAQSRSSASRARILLLGSVVLGGVLAALGGTAKTWRELLEDNLGKLEMTRWVRPLLGDFPWFGVGRGAFESVFPAYQGSLGGVVYTHVESFPAQWLVEWGIPIGVAALFAFGWLFRPGRLGVARSGAAAGAWCGGLALCVQNLADLGLEIPALCFALAVVLGSLWGAQAQTELAMLWPVRRGTVAVRWGAAAVAIGVVLCAGVGRAGMHLLDADRLAVRKEMNGSAPPRTSGQRQRLRAQLRAAMQRHPAEPYFPLIGGALAWQEQDESPVPWLQRALERSRANGRAHLLLAEVLHQHGARLQALMELRLALSADPTLVDSAAGLAVHWTKDEGYLARIVPEGALAAETWDALGAHHPDRDVGSRCDRRAIELDAGRVGPHVRLASDLITARQDKKGCSADEERCGREIEEHARLVEKQAPEESSAGQLRARWLAATGRGREGAKLLADTCENVRDQVACLQMRTQIAASVSDPEPLAQSERALLAAVCMDQGQCARTSTWVGELHMGRSEWGAAANHFARAVQHDETDERLLKLADAAAHAGLNGQAVRALDRVLMHRGGHDAAIEAKIAELKKKLMNGLLR